MLSALTDWLVGAPDAPVTFVHGPGGIGKSAVLHAFQRCAQAAGVAVHWIDGRDEVAAAEALRVALEALQATGGLLILDTYEAVPALGAMVRAACREPHPELRVLIAGRNPPEPAWGDEDDPIGLTVVNLGPLRLDDARTVVRAHGVEDPALVTTVADWADGLPLSLSIAAGAVASGHVLDLDRLDAGAVLARGAAWSGGGRSGLLGADREVIAVAALARAVDARLLGAVLPLTNGDQAEVWLRGLAFSEPLGIRVTLHERVREAVRADLARDPEYERELRRRIADHLYARAALGELQLLADMVELVDDPVIRWGVAPPAAVTHRAGRIVPGDDVRVAELLGARDAVWWAGTQRWFDHAPDRVTVVRDDRDQLTAYGISLTPATAPPWAGEDPVVAPLLADARRRAPAGDVLILREGEELGPSAHTGSPAAAVGTAARIFGCGLRTLRYTYATSWESSPGSERQQAFLLAAGYVRLPELEVDDHGRRLAFFVNDLGPGGLARAARDLVYRQLGVAPPPPLEPTALAAEVVRDVLRSFHDPVALAASPLAVGATPAARAEMVRELLREAAAEAFGTSADEQLQREIIRRGYMDPEQGHGAAARALYLGRTTYFRRLGDAVDRLAAYLLARLG